tara:strand:+ start:210 stop:428 length:219 start_codon:yes stop_codon:yes gene_type:complete
VVREVVKELAEKLETVENEIKLLQSDRRELFLEYKDKIDIKAFRAAWSILKRKENVNEDSLDAILDIMDSTE